MTRIVKILFFLGLATLIGCFVAPSFIDWNKHKDEVIAQIQPYFQRKITVTGNVSFKVLPQPEITLENVSIANEVGAKEANLITLKSLEARVKLEPLLEGQVEVENINLTDPVLNLDVSPDGKTNLTGVIAPSGDMSATASNVKLNQVSITNGTLHYSSQAAGIEKTFDNLNLAVTAGTLLGPYKIMGDMVYGKTKVNIDTNIGVFDKDQSAETHIALTPADDSLPQIKLNGDVSFNAGLTIEGELSFTGKLNGLVNMASLNAFDFMNDGVDMTGTLQFKANQLSLNDIKAKFVKSGSLKGKIVVQFVPQGKASVQADIDANGLIVTSKPSDTYMNVPPEFQGSLNFKGKNVVWDGRHLDTADIVTSFNDKDWTIKSALVILPGNSQIKLAGTVSPATNSAAYTALEITTDDLGKMVDAFAPDNTSIFSTLGGAAPFRKLQLTSGVDITPAKVSFYNMDATLDDKEKVSGVMNVERVAAKPNIEAKLHFTNWDSAALSDAFVQSIMKSDADMELTADNFTRGTLKIDGLTLKAKTDGQGLAIQELSGHLSDKDSFSAAGRVATLVPAITGLDVNYVLKAIHAPAVAKNLGANLPPLAGDNFDIKGELKGDAGKYTYTAQGNSDDVTVQGLQIDHPSFSANVTPSSVNVAGLTGTVWDGKLVADVSYTEQVQPAPSWSSTVKGSLKQADLQKLQDTLGLTGFTTGVGDADFNLASTDNTTKSLTGSVGINASTVTVDKFNADKLSDTLHQFTSMPDNLQRIIDDSFHKNGATVFKDVQGKFQIDHGNASIDSLTMASGSEKLSVSGSADLAAGSYKIAGTLQLEKPAGFPALKITRTSDADYKIDSKPLEDYVIKILPPPPPAKLDDRSPEAAPAPAKNSSAKKDQPINTILQDLDDNPAPAAPAQPAPVQPKPVPVQPQPDMNKMIQQMQMQEMMQQNDTNSPLPLTSP